MINAKEELIRHLFIHKKLKIKCALIQNLILKEGHTKEDFENFLNSLDFEYDNGYGTEFLHGTVWYDDNTWSSRGEYDGSEWWDYNKVPEIPNNLK